MNRATPVCDSTYCRCAWAVPQVEFSDIAQIVIEKDRYHSKKSITEAVRTPEMKIKTG